ncbi:S8 family serine peptidase [Mycobacterium sp. TNTM28]|uniref:S8 family serine peptidase n=1 Tax=[Mycobacterium] fortunisiensis TaxID=2600579 RepID=A0ABS6KPT9_9MYCO|nr:S8 family serine peptidase [[Mycobacterium] fortunisiensis]MBU9765514.1 S8 family serine peptidase [[Mycobacterium] fortunisiensis]
MSQAPTPQPPQQSARAADTDAILGELKSLRDTVVPDPAICVAILDGPVDLSHPCFADAEITRADSLVLDEAGTGAMSGHGTHVASVVFGKPDTGALGLAAGCRGLSVPIFTDSTGRLSQLDLARAIERAMAGGATVINISGGELVERGEPDPLLARTVESCERNGVLIVAAAGNDGCDCLHVPAALPTVLAVGALGRDGTALPSSNFGDRYLVNGVLAPGEAIPGALPGGGIAELTGSSFATPIVSALAALLLSAQRRRGEAIDIDAVRRAVLAAAQPCGSPTADPDPRCLAGILNVHGAHALITQGDTVTETAATPIIEPEPAGVTPSCGGAPCTCGATAAAEAAPAAPAHEAPTPPQAAHPLPASNVFALGNIGFDFGTEARRDGFRQLMPTVESTDETPIVSEPNPYDAVQLANYLDEHPWESTKLIWTMNLNLTPIYAIEAEVTYHEAVYQMLRHALRCQVLPAEDDEFISRVSLPGVLTSRTVTTFAGQRLPVIVVQRRGLYTWNENNLVRAVLGAIDFDRLTNQLGIDRSKAQARTELKLRQMLDKVYYELRNLGQSSADRAINYTATNAFIFSDIMAKGLLAGELVDGDVTSLYSLESISAVKSPFGRLDCDCWDVKITFFSPENERRARVVYQATVDVSDPWPVQLAPIHQYLVSGG